MRLCLAAIATGLALLAEVSVATLPAYACSCVGGTSPQTAARAAVIFTGTAAVVTVSHPGAPLRFSSDDPVQAVFRVDTVYRGDIPAQVTVATVASGASCGFAFQAGQRYTVFAQRDGDALTTNLCSGNVLGPIDPAAYGLTAGVAPSPVAQQAVAHHLPAWWPWVLVAALVAAGTVAVVARRRRSA